MNILNRLFFALLILCGTANAGEICRIYPNGSGDGIPNVVVSRASDVTGVGLPGDIQTWGEDTLSYHDGLIQSNPASGFANIIKNSDPNSLDDLPINSGVSVAEYSWPCGKILNAIYFEDNTETRWAYSVADLTATETYNISIFIKMEDGSAPVYATGSSDSGGDFMMVVDGAPASGTADIYFVGDGVYRISINKTITTGGSDRACGVVKYSGNSSNGFYTSGIQVTQTSYPLPYTPTNGSTVSVAGETKTVDISTHAALRDALSDSDSYDTDGESKFTALFVVVTRYDNPDTAHNVIGTTTGQSLLSVDSSNDRFLATDGTNTAYSSSSVFGDDAGTEYWLIETGDSTADSGNGELQICTSTNQGANWSCGTKTAYDGSFTMGSYLYYGYNSEYLSNFGELIFYNDVLTTSEATTALSINQKTAALLN